MNKPQIIQAFIAQLESDLIAMKEAARVAHAAATHEESKPENEYDTRGLEASYLAGAQAKRAGEIDEVLSMFRNLSDRDLNAKDRVQAGALVEVDINGKSTWMILMPKGGGVKVNSAGKTVQIVTPPSSLGQAIIGLKVGDLTEFSIGEKSSECEIRQIL